MKELYAVAKDIVSTTLIPSLIIFYNAHVKSVKHVGLVSFGR